MTSPRHVVLLAAAGAPLQMVRPGEFVRHDRLGMLPPAPVAGWAVLDLIQAGLLEVACVGDPPRERVVLTEDGWGEAEDIRELLALSSDGRPSRLEILQRLAAAGEGVRRAREADEGELLTLIDVLTGGTVAEWVAPSRGRWVPDPRRPDEPLLGHRERPTQICYDWELTPLRELGLVVVAGGRALLTGAGRWAAADRDASCHANASGNGEAGEVAAGAQDAS